MRGYSSAVATPTSALAAAMLRSAASTSGRRDSSAPTSPIGSQRRLRPRRVQFSQFGGRRPASTAMRYCARRRAAACCGTLACTVASSARRWPGRPRRRARPTPWPGSRAGCPPGCAGWRAPPPAAARRHAARNIARHLGGDHDAGLRQIGGLRLRAAAPRPGAAEQVDFPGRVEAGAIAPGQLRSPSGPGLVCDRLRS